MALDDDVMELLRQTWSAHNRMRAAMGTRGDRDMLLAARDALVALNAAFTLDPTKSSRSWRGWVPPAQVAFTRRMALFYAKQIATLEAQGI